MVSVKPASLAPQAAHFGSAASVVRSPWKQAAQATKYYGNVLVQHQDWMKYMAMIVASAILVASRIGIAWHSVVQSDDPATQAYAKKEAIRTSAREAGGLTFSYILFKVIENKVKGFVEKLGNFDRFTGDTKYHKYVGGDLVNPDDVLPSKWASTKQYFVNLKKALFNKEPLTNLKSAKIYRHLSDLDYGKAEMFSANGKLFGDRYQNSGVFRRLVNGVVGWFSKDGKALLDNVKNATDTNKLDAMRKLYERFAKRLPLVTAGAVALGLSGMLLEWFTLNHMDQVSEKLAKLRHQDLSPASNQMAMDTVHRAERVFQRFGAPAGVYSQG